MCLVLLNSLLRLIKIHWFHSESLRVSPNNCLYCFSTFSFGSISSNFLTARSQNLYEFFCHPFSSSCWSRVFRVTVLFIALTTFKCFFFFRAFFSWLVVFWLFFRLLSSIGGGNILGLQFLFGASSRAVVAGRLLWIGRSSFCGYILHKSNILSFYFFSFCSVSTGRILKLGWNLVVFGLVGFSRCFVSLILSGFVFYQSLARFPMLVSPRILYPFLI